MPPSQLKKLKTSLREQGLVGQQKSRKQRKQESRIGASRDSRIWKDAAVQSIREQCNPFEARPASRRKYEFASNTTNGSGIEKPIVGRPGVTKGLGEENVNLVGVISTEFFSADRHVAKKIVTDGDATAQ